jgi:succinoglycan biosynthesis transport protein ExoP
VTLKDLLRVLHRRWLAVVVVSTLLFLVIFSYARIAEKPAFKSRAKVQLSTPPVLLSATQTSQWISISSVDARTWTSIILGENIRDAALKRLGPDAGPGWLDSVSVAAETDQLLWIEAVGSTPEAAVAAANAVAKAVEAESEARANRDRVAGIEATRKRRAQQRDAQDVAEREARREREGARRAYGVEDLELEHRKVNEDLLSHGMRRRDLDRRIAANHLKLERIREDRTVAEHLQREGAPRLATASAASRVEDSVRVRELSKRVEDLHRDLMSMLRKYTNEHPMVKTARFDLRESELALSRARAEALGRDMDREELALRTDDELAAIEIRVLEPELRALRDRTAALTPILDRVRAAEKSAGEAAARGTLLDGILAQLEATPVATGYVTVEEPATLKRTARIELRFSGWRFQVFSTLLCLVVGVSIAFVLDFVDTTIRTDYDILRHLDWPTLAVVPRVPRSHLLTLIPDDASRGIANVFDTLATVLLSYPSERAARVFLVTGTNPQEGKTSSSINLAAALARQGKRTLLVDGDLRSPAVHANFGLERSAGLSDLLAGTAMPATPGLFIDTQLPTLKLLVCGQPSDSPYEVLDPARVHPVTGQLRELFDVVVIDSPPILGAGDALKFSGAADAILFVIEAGRTDVRQATWAKRLLASVNAKVAGALLNRAGETMAYYHYNYSRTEDGRKLVRSSV